MTMRFTDKNFDYFRDVYSKPYFRISPYLLGMLMGLFLNQRQKTLCPPRKLYVYLGWMLCTFCLLFPIFGFWICDPKLPTPWNGTIWPLSSIVWSVGIAWIVYACLAGCGGIFNAVLKSRTLEPLSKLTFSTYIIHQSVMEIFYGNLEGSFYYSSFLMSYIFAGHLILCYSVAVVFCLCIELPLFNIERLLLGGK
ncbi:nose resistant to fluoxetine protein 6-like [Haemaphysalis longicornis]